MFHNYRDYLKSLTDDELLELEVEMGIELQRAVMHRSWASVEKLAGSLSTLRFVKMMRVR